MAKEVKLGVTVIGVLLLCLGGAVTYRLTKPSDRTVAKATAPAEETASVSDAATLGATAPASDTATPATRVDPFATSSFTKGQDRYASFGIANDATATSDTAGPAANDSASAYASDASQTSGESSSVVVVDDDEETASAIPTSAEFANVSPTGGESEATPQPAATPASGALQPTADPALTSPGGRYGDLFASETSEKAPTTPAATPTESKTGTAPGVSTGATQPSAAGSGFSSNRNAGATADTAPAAATPAGKQVPPATARSSAKDQVKLGRTETLAAFAKRKYGDSQYAELLAEHNRTAYPDPRAIGPGSVISAPSDDELYNLYPHYFEDPAAAGDAGAANSADVAVETEPAAAASSSASFSDPRSAPDTGSFADTREFDRKSSFDPQPEQPAARDDYRSNEPEPTARNEYRDEVQPQPSRRERTQEFADAGRSSANTSVRGTPAVYTVREGDSLFDIARYHLGKASRWSEIYQLNRAQLGENLDRLPPGTKLNLPAR